MKKYKFKIKPALKYNIARYIDRNDGKNILKLALDYIDEIALKEDDDGFIYIGVKGKLSPIIESIQQYNGRNEE